MRTSLRACVALATILSLFLPVATSFAAASISVSPTSGTIGSSTTVSGGGFAANATVRIFFDGANGTQSATVEDGDRATVLVGNEDPTGPRFEGDAVGECAGRHPAELGTGRTAAAT